MAGILLPFAGVSEDGFQVKVPLGGLLLVRFSNFFDNFIFPHGIILPSILPVCK